MAQGWNWQLATELICIKRLKADTYRFMTTRPQPADDEAVDCSLSGGLVGHLLADVGDLGADLEHDPLDAAPDRKVATRRTARVGSTMRKPIGTRSPLTPVPEAAPPALYLGACH